MKTSRFVCFLFCCLLPFFAFTAVYAETTNCTSITSLPYTINTPGIYCLKANRTITNPTTHAITVNADNVTIDLNGFEIRAINMSNNIAAIHAEGRSNITLKNGIISDFSGDDSISINHGATRAKNTLIEYMRISNASSIRVDSDNAVIRNNQIKGTGNNWNGITITDSISTLVINNNISNTPTGIYFDSSDGVVTIENNIIATTPPVTADTYGIYIGGYGSVFIVNNRIANKDIGVYFFGNAYAKYRDNLTIGCNTPYSPQSNAIDAGNNN